MPSLPSSGDKCDSCGHLRPLHWQWSVKSPPDINGITTEEIVTYCSGNSIDAVTDTSKCPCRHFIHEGRQQALPPLMGQGHYDIKAFRDEAQQRTVVTLNGVEIAWLTDMAMDIAGSRRHVLAEFAKKVSHDNAAYVSPAQVVSALKQVWSEELAVGNRNAASLKRIRAIRAKERDHGSP